MAGPQMKYRQESWNPMTGCTRISEGCRLCYVTRQIARLNKLPKIPYFKYGFTPTVHQALIERPLHWRRPRLVTVVNMSDIFHESFPFNLIVRLFSIMTRCPQHQFLLLTKRTERMVDIAKNLSWSDNIWMGVSVENMDHIDRIDHLRSVPATKKWVTFEPLIGQIVNPNLTDINWVVVAHESYSRKNSPLYLDWARMIRDDCAKYPIPLFIKDRLQSDERWTGGRELDGVVWNQMPQQLKLHSTSYLRREADVFKKAF